MIKTVSNLLHAYRMRRSLSRLLITIGFASGLFSCLDHRLGGTLSPVLLRLKTLQSSTTGLTTYTYDTQNRLSTIAKSDGSLNVLSYDDTGKKYIYFNEYAKATDQTTGQVTLYHYNLDGTSFTAYRYPIINSAPFYGITNATFAYGFDGNKHLVRYYQTDGRDLLKARRKPLANYFRYYRDTCQLPVITNGPTLGLLLDIVRFTDEMTFLKPVLAV